MQTNVTYLHLGSKYGHFCAQRGKDKIWEDNEVTFLGITIHKEVLREVKIKSGKIMK